MLVTPGSERVKEEAHIQGSTLAVDMQLAKY